MYSYCKVCKKEVENPNRKPLNRSQVTIWVIIFVATIGIGLLIFAIYYASRPKVYCPDCYTKLEKSDKPFENKTGMLWTRYFNPPPDMLNGKKIIHGHDPVPMKTILEHIEKGYATIPLDNGVPYVGKHKIYNTSKLGSLCAFDMDDRILYSQRNIET